MVRFCLSRLFDCIGNSSPATYMQIRREKRRARRQSKSTIPKKVPLQGVSQGENEVEMQVEVDDTLDISIPSNRRGKRERERGREELCSPLNVWQAQKMWHSPAWLPQWYHPRRVREASERSGGTCFGESVTVER